MSKKKRRKPTRKQIEKEIALLPNCSEWIEMDLFKEEVKKLLGSPNSKNSIVAYIAKLSWLYKKYPSPEAREEFYQQLKGI